MKLSIFKLLSNKFKNCLDENTSIKKLLLSRKKTNYHYEDAIAFSVLFYIYYRFKASVTR